MDSLLFAGFHFLTLFFLKISHDEVLFSSSGRRRKTLALSGKREPFLKKASKTSNCVVLTRTIITCVN